MKKFSFIFTLLLAAVITMPNVSFAQSTVTDDVYVIEETTPIPANETKKDRKQRIKKDKQIVDSIYSLKALKAINDRYFVLQATEVSNNYGNFSLGLNDNTNFLLLQGDKGIFQVAYNTASPGLNGLGGVTLHGRVGKMNMTQAKNGNVIVSFNMIGSSMNATVSLTIFANSDQAIADIYPTMSGGRISMRGRLVPYRNDDIRITP